MLYYSTWPISEQKKVSAKNYLLDEVNVLSFCNFAFVHDSDWDRKETKEEEHQQALASAFNEGIAEGEARGEARGRSEGIAEGEARGLSAEDISRI